MGIFGNLFANFNTRQINKISLIVDKIEDLAPKYSEMTDDELKSCTLDFKQRLENGESDATILPEAFAVVREASTRVLNMRHYRVQLMGGVVLHQGRIAEMSTGEGKTLVATLPAYLNALKGKGMHIVTVNDYLAKRDAEWMGKVYSFLGLSVGVAISGMDSEQKRAAYNADITYATNNELGFDYLRDNMAVRKEDRLQRGLEFAIIDEVDSILIDEARTPLIISGKGEKSSELYLTANRFAKSLLPVKNAEDPEDGGDYIVEEKEKTVRLSEYGVEKAERFFKVENLSDIENQDLVHYINNALKANYIMKLDSNYIVNDGEVVIVDEFTGRLMVGRRYSDGLHQAIEAKENVRIKGESQTLATITFQNYFRLYKKLSGMTGTAKTEEQEFKDIYMLDVVILPTNRPSLRIDENDKLYTTQKGKLNAVVQDIKAANEKGQPVLVGTVTVEKSEELSNLLRKNRIPHNVLNAKNHKREAEIVAQAGRKGAVTIATNMAGRGTDIMLGGNPEYLAQEKLEKLGYSEEVISLSNSFTHNENEDVLKAREEYTHYFNLFKKDTDAEKQEVIAAGGLRIIGTERHESRRIDNQLRGRSARQGDPGSTVFYLSMEDEMLRVFGGDQMKSVADRFNFAPDEPISLKLITNVIERAQARVEDRNFSARKHILAYDDVLNAQRDIIYTERNKVLDGIDVHEQILKMMDGVVCDIINTYADFKDDYRTWDFDGFNRALEESVLEVGTEVVTKELASHEDITELRDTILGKAIEQYEDKVQHAAELGLDFSEVERAWMLRSVDRLWIEHIDAMAKLREGIGLRAYGQQDPVLAYRKESFDMFDDLIENIHKETVKTLCTARIERQVERKVQAKETANNMQSGTVVREGKKIGRNDPCPCGSGKKYKNCCGSDN